MMRLRARMSTNLFSFVRLFVLLLGFVTICLGAFCISTSASGCKCNSLPLAYFLLPLGFFFLIAGISWSTYHEASKHNSLFHSIIHGIPRLQESHITTIDRPDFYPPSYDDSTALGKQTFSLPDCSLEPKSYAYNIPPPLYTESRFEFIEETGDQEQQPPSYEVSVQQRPTGNDPTFGEASHAPQP
ncbi:PREDICTED: transmembrane protein 252 isoform X2 [Thamnophis sirtalis]|uniref:Transmembrane protein 252 isoform X2 n=1 Tax=Thamnophis sirtalis TaxID=35019 RepID=A0A6I9XRF4_9SAUR|nr:PREDICTED: transmembrane protein 252 isoform X2 [Thamnophis sirtalis]